MRAVLKASSCCSVQSARRRFATALIAARPPFATISCRVELVAWLPVAPIADMPAPRAASCFGGQTA